MKLRLARSIALILLFAGATAVASADEIKVSPGAGALAAGLAKAKSGDVVKVAAGEYAESVAVGEGVTVEGEGAAKTIIIPPDYAGLNCKGPRVRIVGLTIRGGEKNVRGVNTSGPVRVERCRFEKVKEAIAMMEAPLSDVIACEFEDCAIGVRAIGGASPTVWGCSFKGGNMGVFGMDGSAYIRNNLFDSVKFGIRVLPDATQPGVIRNNVFVNCETAAIEIMSGKESLFGPSIRNSVVVKCGAAVVAPASLVANTSHGVLHEVKAPAMREADGKETVKIGDANLSEGAIAVTVDKDFNVKADHQELLDAKGVRLCVEKEGATGTIGLEKAWSRVGTGATGELPGQRWGGKMLIANSVHEEYQYLKVIRRGSTGQSMGNKGGIPVDTMKLSGAGEPKEIQFDISRFFGEESVK